MSEQRFDPEVVALLDHIARDPNASLLCIPKRPLLEWVGRPVETISPHGSHLTRAEKHLVTAYREEAAWVLLEACILRLKEDPQCHSTIAPDPGVIQASARRLVDRIERHDSSTDILRVLAERTEIERSSIALASLRLAPSELGFNCLAVAHQQEGHLQASLRVLGRFFDGASSTRQLAQAWENRGRVHVLRGEFEKAYQCESRASRIDEAPSRFLVWCLAAALQGGYEAGARESAARLDAHPGQSTQFVDGLREARQRGMWSPTNEGQQLSSRIRGEMAEKSRAVCDAFT